MMISEAQKGSPVSSVSAAAPKTLLMASQPIEVAQLTTPGTAMLLPKEARDTGIWANPVWGPMDASTPASRLPMTLPRRMASRPVHHPRPMKEAVASVPRKKAAGTMLGAKKTVKLR